MLNIQTFNDTDGNRVEINRREVRDAYVGRRDGRSTIQITWGEGKACTLGIGAREEIESWLGRELGVLSPMAAAYVKPAAATAKDLAWLDVRLALLRDEAIVRVGPAVAAREMVALAMAVLHPPDGPVPAHQRAAQLVRHATDSLVALAGGDGNGLRTADDYQRALMDEWPAVKALLATSTGAQA